MDWERIGFAVGRFIVALLEYALKFIALVAAGNAAAASPTEQDLLRNLQMDTRLAQTVTVADLVTYAYLNNPSIQSAKEAWKATVEKYRLETGYPDPQFSATYFPEPIETRLGSQSGREAQAQCGEEACSEGAGRGGEQGRRSRRIALASGEGCSMTETREYETSGTTREPNPPRRPSSRTAHSGRNGTTLRFARLRTRCAVSW